MGEYQNLRDAWSSELSDEDTRRLVTEANQIYQADSAAGAQAGLHAWAEHWRSQEPKAVATLERDCAATIAWYALPLDLQALARKTSLLGRANRELRRKFR